MSPSWSSTFRYWLLSAIAILLIFVLWSIREMIGPLVIAALLAFVLNPAVGALRRRSGISHSLAVSLVFFAGLAILIGIPALALPNLVEETQVFIDDLQSILTGLQASLSEPVVLFGLVFHLENALPDLTNLISESIAVVPESAVRLLEATTKNFIWILVIIVATYYLLRDWARLRDWLFSLVPEPYLPDARRIYLEIKEVWQGYLRGNLALMLIVGVIFTLAWLAIGVPGALILGIIAGILTIIPDLGPAIAAALSAFVALFEGSTYLPISNSWFALLVIGVYTLLINIKNIWIRPRIFARSVHMHDGIVFVAIMAAVVLQGILGALIVVPVLASGGVVARYLFRRILGLPPWPEPEAETESAPQVPVDGVAQAEVQE